MTDLVEVRRGAYYDSVSLMQVSKAVREVPGISAALVAMATDLNTDLLAGMGFTVDEAVGPNDMLVAFRGEHQAAIEAGRAALDDALAALKAAGTSAGGFGDAPPSRTRHAAEQTSPSSLGPAPTPSSRRWMR
jgi:FdrA protein